MRNRIVVAAALLSLVVTAALVIRLLAIDNAPAVIILIPALTGALLPFGSRRAGVLSAAAILSGLTALVSLFGGVGLLYVPSIAAFIWGAISPNERQAV